jgi:hypothetical protein
MQVSKQSAASDLLIYRVHAGEIDFGTIYVPKNNLQDALFVRCPDSTAPIDDRLIQSARWNAIQKAQLDRLS